MDDNKKILQSGGTTEPKIESASNANYLDDLYSSAGIKPFTSSDNSAYTKFTDKGTNLQNYNFPDINEKNPLSSYTEYGVNVGAGKDYNLQRAQNQTWTDNLSNFAARFVPKVAFGTIGLAGHLGGLLFDQDGDYENALTTWAKESEEYFTSDNKNYAENPNASFFSGEYWLDPANVFDAIDGVLTSAATFALPGIGVASATGRIAAGISKALSASAKATRGGMAMATGASSLTMGYAEAAMSGADIYKEQLEKNLAKGMQYNDAKRIATGAAQTTVRMATIFNTALNIPILGSFTQKTDDILRKEVGDIVDDLNLRTVDNKGNVVDAVTGKPIDQAKDLGGVKQMPDAIKNLPKIDEVKDLKAATERLKNIELKPSTWKDAAKVYGKEALLESLEEGQIALAEEAGRKYTDPDGTGQSFIKTLKDAFSGIGKEQFWESAALGALGGVGMKALFDIAPVNREVSEVDPNITFDAATQTHRTPEGKEVKDNLKRNADGTLIKKRMRASTYDNEQKKAMIASEVAHMVEDLSTTQYWQEKMQTITDDFKNQRKVIDETLEDGTIKPRVMTKGEAAIKLQEAKAQLFNISARRSIMSGKGDNFKLVFQNIANTSNDDAKILEAKIESELKELSTAKSKYEDIIADTNSTPEQKEQAKQELENISNKAKELNAQKGLSSAQLQGFSSGDNDNEYKEEALQAIAKIDAYTKEYNQLKDTYDYGTAESRQALGKLLENRMKRHTWKYMLESDKQKLIKLFDTALDVSDKSNNDYLRYYNHLIHNSKVEIERLQKKLMSVADEQFQSQDNQDAFIKELNDYSRGKLNDDLTEILNDVNKRKKYEDAQGAYLNGLKDAKAELEKERDEEVRQIELAKQQVVNQTPEEQDKTNNNIANAEEKVKTINDKIAKLTKAISDFSNIINFIAINLKGEKEQEYKKQLINDKLQLLDKQLKQYETSQANVDRLTQEIKDTDAQDVVKFNKLRNELVNELKNAKFGFLDLSSLGLKPEDMNGKSYQEVVDTIEKQKTQFDVAINRIFKSPELQRLNIETSNKLEELDKEFEQMTTKGGHDKLVANAYELHKRQTNLFLDYINGVENINNGGTNQSTPVASTAAINTQPTQTPERKNKYGITESKYSEYVNLEAIKQSYEQGIDSANKTIQEAEENIKNANGNKKLIIQNEQLIVDTKNKLDAYKNQLAEINKQIKAILKDSPFETINNEVEKLKNEVTNNRDKDIASSRKEDISANPDRWNNRQLVWRELFAAYDNYLKAIDDYKNASLENISTFGDALYNSRLNDLEQALSNASNEFETAKRNSEKEFLRIEREIKLAENPNLFKDYQATNYAGKLSDLREQLNNFDLSSSTYQRDRMILENEIGLYENLNQASLDYQEALADSLVSGASQQDLADKYKEYVVALEKLRKESNSEITRKATALQEQIDITDKESDRLLDTINKGFRDVEIKAGVKKAIENLYKLYNDKSKALRSNSLSLIPNIDSAIIEAQQELDEAVEREILAEEEIEIEKEKQKQIEVLKNRINEQKQKLDEYSKLYSKNSGTTKKLIAGLQNELNDILSNIANVSIDDTKQLLDDIDTQTKAVVNSIYGTPMLKYLNNGGKSVFSNSDEVVAFLKELGLDSENVSPLLSGAFENKADLTITLTYDDESTVRGNYDSINNRIELNSAYLQTPEQAREVLMHELVHALTRERFQDPNSKIVAKTIEVLDKWLGVLGESKLDENNKEVSTIEKLERIRNNSKNPINDNLKEVFDRIINAVKGKNGFVDETRLDELYAEAFSNKEFAELLKSQTIEGSYKQDGNYKVKGKTIRVKTSIWKKFMSVVLDGVANIITHIISDKPRQISILNELALILNDNPAFIETPEETTNKLAEEKVLGDEKVIETQQQEQEPTNDIEPEQENDTTPTIDLTKQTFVAIPDDPVDTQVEKSPDLASNINEQLIADIDFNNSSEQTNLREIGISAQATPEEDEEVIVDINELTNLLETTGTILDNALDEIEIANIVKEQEALKQETLIESLKLIDEIKSFEESFEALSFTLPSGQEVIEQVLTEEAQDAIEKIENNTEAMLNDIDKNSEKEIAKVEKEKKKRNSKPKTPKQVSSNEVKTNSQEPVNLPESGTIKADNDLGISEDTPVIVQPNGDGSNTILPAENNRISKSPQPIAGAEPISTNAPNSSVLRDVEPSNTKTPERKDNAATALKEPVIDKEGIPIRGSKLEGDLLKANKDKAIVSNKLAITKEPNEKQAIRKVNDDGSLSEPLLPLFDKGTYDKGLTSKRKNQSAFVVSEEANTSPLELVKPDNENTSYTPGLSADMTEFEKWYEELIDDEEKINKLSDIDFKDTPIADSDFYSNQNAIFSILKDERIEDEAIRKNRIKLQYVAGNKRLAKAFNDTFGSKDNKGLSELSIDIIEDENKVIRVEKADSLEGTGWERSDDDTFVKTFNTIDDFLDNTDFLAFGQGKLNAIYSDSKEVTVIAMTNPLVENNSVRVILEDLSSSGALIVSGNFQNPNRFTKVTFTKQENGSTKVTLDFLNTDNKFAKAFKDDSLFDKSELSTEDDFTLDYDIESYIDSNAAARTLMSNFATGLKNNHEDAFELITAKEKRVYLDNAEIKFTIREVNSQTSPLDIFAKNKEKIVYYENQKNGVAKTYNFEDFDGGNTFKLLEEKLKRNKVKGKYVFVKLKDTYLPVKIKAKPLLSLKSGDTAFEKLMTNLENHLKDKTDVKSINEALITFNKNNIYVAHGLGDEKLYLNYELSDNGKRLKLKAGGEFIADHPIKKLSDIKEVIKNNIISDFKRVVGELNNLYKNDERYKDLRNDSRYKNFNNNLFDNKSIILSPGDFTDVDSLLSFFDIPFDPLKPFSEVSFSYTGNKTFEAPPEKPKIQETFTESPIVNDNIMEQTPERKMIPYAVTSSNLDSSLRITADGFEKEIEQFMDFIRDEEIVIEGEIVELQSIEANDLLPIIPDIKSRYPTLSELGFMDNAIYGILSSISVSLDPDTQNQLREILTEINDLVSRLKDISSEDKEPNVDPKQISKDKNFKEC